MLFNDSVIRKTYAIRLADHRNSSAEDVKAGYLAHWQKDRQRVRFNA
jgi:hypothetical protein